MTTAMLTDQLKNSLSTHTADGPVDNTAALALCQALDHGRISFGLEPFHNLNDSNTPFASAVSTMPMEYLLRPVTDDGSPIALGQALGTMRKLGMTAQLDLAIIPRAIEQALSFGDGGFPVSVNIAPESLKEEAFLVALGTYLHQLESRLHSTADVVLEVPLDGATTENAIAWLLNLKDAGFRLAVDNFGAYTPYEYRNLSRLAPDFVKIDGRMVENALLGLPGLGDVASQVRNATPHSRVLAAWVASVEDAKRLHDTFKIDAVQGRKLPKDRAYFASQWDYLLFADRRNQRLDG